MNQNPSPTLRTCGVTKSFSSNDMVTNAVEGVSMDITAGEMCVLVGRSGSGKTTFLNLAGLIDQPTSGEVYFDGVPMTGVSERERARIRLREISFIFQDFGLLPFLKVWENISYKLLLQGRAAGWIRERVDAVARDFGIQDKLNAYPPQLSGGQQQRVSIARAIVSETKLLVADEMTANLDEENSELVMKLLKTAQRKSRLAILIATHDPLVRSFATKVYRMQGGRVELAESGQ